MRLVHVPARVHDEFWAEWRAINRSYPTFDAAPEDVSLVDHWTNLAALREVARDELRRATYAALKDLGDENLGADRVLAL